MLNKSIKQGIGYYHWGQAVKKDLKAQHTQAIGYYHKALIYLPKQGELLFNLGANYSSIGAFNKGVYYMEQSKKNLKDKNQMLSLAQSYMNQGKLEKAENYAKEVEAAFPDQLLPRFLLGIIYHKQKKFKESLKLLQSVANEETTVKSFDTKQISNLANNEIKRLYNK